MAIYCYRTESGACEGAKSEVQFHMCYGSFEIKKPMSEATRPEKCRMCEANLVKDLQAQGVPGAKFVGPGFYVNEK